MNGAKSLVIAAAAVLALAGAIDAGSIWAKASRQTRPMHADDTACDVGDILTIMIDERSVIETDTNRKMSKDSSGDASMDGTADLRDLVSSVRGKKGFRFPQIDMEYSAKTGFDGKAAYDTDRSIADQITVVVEDVLPNGNMVVLGARSREVDGEKQVIQVSGIVRPSDISFSNSIKSDRVADFRLVSTITGQEKQYTNPGWFMKLMSLVNPF